MPHLLDARIEKIQEPQTGLLVVGIFSHGKKNQLFFKYGRQGSFIFFSDLRLPASKEPPAPVMRIRRYFNDRRITAVVPKYIERELWLLDSAIENGKAVWLCLNFIKGPKLFFLDEKEVPVEDALQWPETDNISQAATNWQQWPVMTPGLRKTLTHLDEIDQRALLVDLESGLGDVYIYKNKDSKTEKISPWPLPQNLRSGFDEFSSPDILSAFQEMGNHTVLAPIFDKRVSGILNQEEKKRKKLRKLAENLAKDKLELESRLEKEKYALQIQANLWRWAKNYKTAKLVIPGADAEPQLQIDLNPLLTIQENMENFFKKARGAKHGLKILAERLENIKAELKNLHVQPMQEKTKPTPAQVLARAMPKNVQAFISSEGYLMLRGKDASGNRALRKLAAPHDLWTHVETGPGAHLVIRNSKPGQPIPEQTLDEAGSLAATKSWLANSDQASIMYAELRHVKPIRSSNAGMVSIDKLAFTRLVKILPELEQKLRRAETMEQKN